MILVLLSSSQNPGQEHYKQLGSESGEAPLAWATKRKRIFLSGFNITSDWREKFPPRTDTNRYCDWMQMTEHETVWPHMRESLERQRHVLFCCQGVGTAKFLTGKIALQWNFQCWHKHWSLGQRLDRSRAKKNRPKGPWGDLPETTYAPIITYQTCAFVIWLKYGCWG